MVAGTSKINAEGKPAKNNKDKLPAKTADATDNKFNENGTFLILLSRIRYGRATPPRTGLQINMTIKNRIHRLFPILDRMDEHPRLQAALGFILHHPYLWHFNRRVVARAVASGLFWAFIPVPFQMILSGLTAFYLRANLPIAVALVWISNPLTIPPLTYVSYLIGFKLLNKEPAGDFGVWDLDVAALFGVYFVPIIIGSLFLACVLSFIGYVGTRVVWNVMVRITAHRRSYRN